MAEVVDFAVGVLPLVDSVQTVGRNVFSKRNVELVELRNLLYVMNETIQYFLSKRSAMSATTLSAMYKHYDVVNHNLRLIGDLERQLPNRWVTNRPRIRKDLLDKLKRESSEVSNFLRTEVATLLERAKIAEPQFETERYIPNHKVPSNPPRLLLNYDAISTNEGKLKSAVLEHEDRKVVSIVVRGMGGVGKTCALRGLAHDPDIRERFTGGTLYIELGVDAVDSTVISSIWKSVEGTGGTSSAVNVAGAGTIQGAVREASPWFRPHNCLLLIDDIWWRNGIDSSVLRELGTMVNERSRVVYTTRDGKFMDYCDKGVEFMAEETNGDLARGILFTHGGFDWKERLSDGNEEAVKEILHVCQGLPAALGAAGETVYRMGQSRQDPIEDAWCDANTVIKSRLIDLETPKYGSVRLIADTSLGSLDRQMGPFGRMFRALCVLDKQQMVPIEMLRKLWGLEDLSKTMDIVNGFHDVCLVRKVVSGNTRVFVQLHDLILEIAIRKAAEWEEREAIFRKLVDSYVAANAGGSQGTDPNRIGQDAITPVGERGGKNRVLRGLKRACCLGGGVSSEARNESQEEIVDVGAEVDRNEVDRWEGDDGGYMRDNLRRMLIEVGYEQEFLGLFSRPEWVVSRVQNRGISGVEVDVHVGKQIATSAKFVDRGLMRHLEIVKAVAQLASAHVNESKRESWFQIHGRLLWYATQCERTKRFVEDMEACAPKPWARASMGFLEQAGAAALHTFHVGRIVYSVRLDGEELACCWVWGTTVGVTRYALASGATETQEQICDKIEGDLHNYYHQNRVSLSRDVKTVVVGLRNGEVWIWNTDTDETKVSAEHHDRGVACVDISEDGRLIASGSEDRTVRLWNASSGERVGRVLVGRQSSVECVAFSPDGSRVASGSKDSRVRLWDVEKGVRLHGLLSGHGDMVTCVAWSADGSRIASGSDDRTVRLWDANSGKAVGEALVGHTEEVVCVAWSADNRSVVSGSTDCTLRTWDVTRGAATAEVLVGHLHAVYCATWSWSGTRVVSGSRDDSVRVWAVRCGGSVLHDGRHSARVNCVALDKHGSRALTASADGTLRLWDLRNGMPLGQAFVGHTAAVNCVAWSMDERHAVSGADDGSVRLWDIESQEALGQPWYGPEEDVTCVALSHDGIYIASGSLDGIVRVRQVKDDRDFGTRLAGHTDGVVCVAWRRDREQVASGSTDMTVRVWNVRSGTVVRQLVGHTDDVDCISWSSRGNLIASGSWDGTVRVWSVESGKLKGPPLVHRGAVQEVGLSADGSRVVSKERGGLQRIWCVADGQSVATSDDEQWDETMRKLQQQGIATGRRSRWFPPSNRVTEVKADGSEIVLGTCESGVERIGHLWFSQARFGHCHVMR